MGRSNPRAWALHMEIRLRGPDRGMMRAAWAEVIQAACLASDWPRDEGPKGEGRRGMACYWGLDCFGAGPCEGTRLLGLAMTGLSPLLYFHV